MQKWQKCFLIQALKYGACVHQRHEGNKYYPYKQKFNEQSYTNRISQLQREIKLLNQNPNQFKSEYDKQAEAFLNSNNQRKLQLQKNIQEDRKHYNIISKINIGNAFDNTLGIIKNSCLGNLKKRIYNNQIEYKSMLSNCSELEKFGIWTQKKLQNCKHQLECLKDSLQQAKLSVKNRNQIIDELYRSIGLNSEDFYKVEIQFE